MDKINVYLAKSNRADPTTVSRVRTFIKYHRNVLSLREFNGGKYTNHDLVSCDYVVFVLETGTSTIGKGLHYQIEDCIQENIEFTIIYTSTYGNFFAIEQSDVALPSRVNCDDYINYSKLKIDPSVFEHSNTRLSIDKLLVNRISSDIMEIAGVKPIHNRPLTPEECISPKELSTNSKDLLLLSLSGNL